MARVVIVGAGIGGLAAAARLGALGHEVTVLEAAEVVGGKVGLLEHATPSGTFRFDTGPSLLTMPEVFAELFRDTGEPMESVLALRRIEPALRYCFGDGTVLTTSSDSVVQASRMEQAFGTGAGAAWTALIRRGARIWRAVEQPVLRSPLSIASAARSSGRVAALTAVSPARTLRQLGRQYLDDPRQRLMLERYATYAGADPRRAPAALAVIPYLEQAFGSWHIEGGMRRLAEALADRATDRGVTIRVGARVTRITTAAGKVDQVGLADGTVLPADVVVANADASSVFGHLLQPPPSRVPEADSLSGFAVLLGVRGGTPGLAGRNVLFGQSDYGAEFDAVFDRPGRPVADPAIYVSSPEDPATCPPGHEAWFVLVNATRHGADGGRGTLDWDHAGLSAGYAERLVSLLGQRGLPVRERVVFTDVITPADLQRRTGAPGGAIYGSALHGRMASFRRPANATSVRGLFLVGGSTHPGGGLPLVALSAAIVADLVGPA